MIIKTFTASDIEKALWLLNEELGPAAVILRTRLFNGNRLNQPKYIEITAALDSSLLGKKIEDHKFVRSNLPSKILNQFSPEFENCDKDDSDAQAEFVEVIGW